MTSSEGTRHSRARPFFEAAGVCLSLFLLITGAVAWAYRHGYILYYGDAQSHLNLSRSLIDSRTPGYEQLGTVWLPLLHLICMPLARSDWFWSTGLAGSIPVAACFVVAGCCLYFAAREAYQSAGAAVVTLCCFALNPNILYLGSIPMTEMVFFAGLAAFVFCLLRFRTTQDLFYVALGVAASWAMSLTRYDGWFLAPFGVVWFASFAGRRRGTILLAVGVLASIAPLSWCLYCWWETGNPFTFFNGPYSPQAIQGGKPYPGYHDWKTAITFYAVAGEACSGWGLTVLGLCGMGCALLKQVFAPVGFLCLLLFFYVWSVHSSGLPIYLPQIYFGSYYNSRYGLAAVVVLALAAGALFLVVPRQWGRAAVVVLPLLSLAPWLWQPGEERWICWKESEVNSVARRAWTQQAASLFSRINHAQGGILTSWGDIPGIYCRARIPISETLNIGNGPIWTANVSRPDLIHQAAWAVAQEGDDLSKALRAKNSFYQVEREIEVEHAPRLQIYRRRDPVPIPSAADIWK